MYMPMLVLNTAFAGSEGLSGAPTLQRLLQKEQLIIHEHQQHKAETQCSDDRHQDVGLSFLVHCGTQVGSTARSSSYGETLFEGCSPASVGRELLPGVSDAAGHL